MLQGSEPGPGDFVGETAAPLQGSRSATVTALSALDVLVITDQNFGGLLDKMLTLWPKLAQALAERVARDESASS